MKIDVRVEATENEKRRLIGRADITPIIEVLSIMLDQAMLAVVDARLEALTAELATGEEKGAR